MIQDIAIRNPVVTTHPSQFHRTDTVNEPLYVITPVFNPERYRTRWKLYKAFEKYVINSGANLVTIEASFGNRAEVYTKPVHENHIVVNVRTPHELWIKENLINVAISKLPADWKYVAWVDADITFSRPDWVGECIQQLQHFHMLQMFSESHDLNYDFENIKVHKGFIYSWRKYLAGEIPPFKGVPPIYSGDQGGKGVSYWHPGFAWAARREAIDSLGGLIDWSILGGGDTFMAYALVNMLNERTMPNSLGEAGVRWLREWQERANKYIRGNVGYMNGTIYHYWHGSRKDRAYWDRGTILTRSNFNPELDLKKDWQGVYQLTDRSSQLRDDIRNYFRQRNEDSVD